MKVITIINSKGGCAKTTSVWHLGVGLQKRGLRVLLVDLDAQCNLSFTAGVDLLNTTTTIYEVFTGEAKTEDALTSIDTNLDILVGSIDLVSADRTFTQLGRERMLKKALTPLEDRYDYAIVDVPPVLGVMCENALTASNEVIIPMTPEIYGLQGINQLHGLIEDIRDNTNPHLVVKGILITRVSERTNLYKEMRKQFEAVAERMNTKVFDTVIRDTVAVREVALQRSNLFDEVPNATATKDYQAFIDEFIGR